MQMLPMQTSNGKETNSNNNGTHSRNASVTDSVHRSQLLTVGDKALSANREIVKLLDCEPLLDYLLQNGVITPSDRCSIEGENDTNKQNYTLLRCLEARPGARQLFANGLRLTGQHYLANMVDDSTRIKVLSGSGYLSKSRHKGEIAIMVSVHSMRLSERPFKTAAALLHKDWISLEDIQMKISSLKRLHSSRRTSFKEKKTSEQSPSQSVCCFCCCCNGSTDEKKSQALLNMQDSYIEKPRDEKSLEEPVDFSMVVVSCQPKRYSDYYTSSIDRSVVGTRVSRLQQEEQQLHSSVENLREVANSIQEHCEKLYLILSDSGSHVNGSLLRYFEQDRGVLVLNIEAANDGATILCICTKAEHVNCLHDDHSSNKLITDLERIICTEEILELLSIVGLKLCVEINSESLEAARQELI